MMSEQESKEGRRSESFNWTLWLKWVLVSTLGWAIGVRLETDFVIGAVIGILQWLVLRPLIQRSGWWIVASAVGWAASEALIGLVLPPQSAVLAFAVIGAGIGLAQWLTLRWQVHRAWWWIVLSTLGWTVGMMGILGVSLTGAAAGAVTGVALEFLLRHPRPELEDWKAH